MQLVTAHWSVSCKKPATEKAHIALIGPLYWSELAQPAIFVKLRLKCEDWEKHLIGFKITVRLWITLKYHYQHLPNDFLHYCASILIWLAYTTKSVPKNTELKVWITLKNLPKHIHRSPAVCSRRLWDRRKRHKRGREQGLLAPFCRLCRPFCGSTGRWYCNCQVAGEGEGPPTEDLAPARSTEKRDIRCKITFFFNLFFFFLNWSCNHCILRRKSFYLEHLHGLF